MIRTRKVMKEVEVTELFCDVCGVEPYNFNEPYKTGAGSYNVHTHDHRMRIDICGKCTDKMVARACMLQREEDLSK